MIREIIIQVVCLIIQIAVFIWSQVILHKARKIREETSKMLDELELYFERDNGNEIDAH